VVPLTDLRSAEYFGFAGGLYPNGRNSPPSAYKQAGVRVGETVQPLDRAGTASSSGKIGMICVGMSNASSEFSQFIWLAEAHARKNPNLSMIDVARNRADAAAIAAANNDYWTNVDRQLTRAEISPAQVQVAWLKTALAEEPCDFPEKAMLLQTKLRMIVGILRAKFQQLKLVYVSSRTYGGYSETDLSPEPIAYETGFAVKWLIEECIKDSSGDRSMPWVSWGPYLWADGLSPRSDGLVWERNDFQSDGVHPSTPGALKVATMLLEFFQKNPSAKPWFLSHVK
jgi:hypothetical protein